jgi:hypothetical protein
MNARPGGYRAATERLGLRQPFLPGKARAARIGHEPHTPAGRKLTGESGHELRALNECGNCAQVTRPDVVEHEFQAEAADGLEGIGGGLRSPGELVVERAAGRQPGLVIVGPQVDRVQRQVMGAGQLPGPRALPCPLRAADPDHRRPLSVPWQVHGH